MADTRPQGLDTSHYTGDVTVHTLDGSAFAFGQATVGLWQDPAFAGDLATFHRARIVTGAYHYGVYGPGPTRQAEFFIAHAGDADLLALDAETRGSNRLLNHPDAIRALLIDIRKADDLGRPVGLYSSRGTLAWSAYLDLVDFTWVADYNGEPDRAGVTPRVKWTFWQKSGTFIDRDVFNGTLAQLKALAHSKGGNP